ncbi:MAG TPA: lanthionine synthetase LanC family protein [Bryobacteraceae bacterium]|nr:lanthionine synthetase LanC family protein [Bryobacteraceae bacterium]
MTRVAENIFVSEALRIGRELVGTAIRHEGCCSWVGNQIANSETWHRTARVIGADFGTGTAGIAWFLMNAGIAANEPVMVEVAVEALRHSLHSVDQLVAEGRLGFCEGALGIAWTALAAGRAIESAELQEAGLKAAKHTVEAVNKNQVNGLGLWEGEAGRLLGSLGMFSLCEDRELLEHARVFAHRLTDGIGRVKHSQRSSVGLAKGASGVGLALAALAACTEEDPSTAQQAFRSERLWHSGEAGWYGSPAHDWAEPMTVTRSLCSGAAGIGIARLAAYAVTGAVYLLAEAGAAIDIIRRMPPPPDGPDASLCHGAAGEIELLLAGYGVLGEAAHLQAARYMGQVMIETAQMRGEYASGIGAFGPSPSFLLGSAGTGLVLLRLYDPALAPSAAVPPLLL